MRTGSAVDDPIPLSLLSQAGYCLRRAALLTNEQVWSESADTAKGRAEHERVHTERVERRGTEAKLYEYPVFSKNLGMNGKCDCIEAAYDAQGCAIPAVDFPVTLYPVEFKHGKVRREPEYEIQLCAQAMCLEEMYHTRIPEGAIFYITAHRRLTVALDQPLRQKVLDTLASIDRIRREFWLPPGEAGPKCTRCSLREICMPGVAASAADYCAQLEIEARRMDTP
jgi:CRISPR-associated exonuclease Cas4